MEEQLVTLRQWKYWLTVHGCNRFRKEKCSEEDINKNKEVMVPYNKQHHHGNVLEVLHKMVWLQNQNICAELGR
jgi:hypothetical protein